MAELEPTSRQSVLLSVQSAAWPGAQKLSYLKGKVFTFNIQYLFLFFVDYSTKRMESQFLIDWRTCQFDKMYYM